MRKFLAGLTVLGLVTMGVFTPVAMADNFAMILVMDVSGSINDTEYNLQKQGYHDAITSLIPTDGTVALAAIQFGRNNTVDVAWDVIQSVAERDAFADAILSSTRAGINTGYTAIGDAIYAADVYFGSLSGFVPDHYIIDVSTDGANNYGSSPVTAAQWVVDSGSTDVVNALGIGVTPTFAYGFNYDGTEAFNVKTTDFASFSAALNEKFEKEIVVTTPEPLTLLLLGLGLAGLAGVRRKIQK